MVNKRHCCYGLCNNDSRFPNRPGMEGVYFIHFPKPKTKLAKCERWIRKCGRPDYQFNVSRITSSTFICSKHFVGGKGPTDEHPDPIQATVSTEQFNLLQFNLQSRRKKLETSNDSEVGAAEGLSGLSDVEPITADDQDWNTQSNHFIHDKPTQNYHNPQPTTHNPQPTDPYIAVIPRQKSSKICDLVERLDNVRGPTILESKAQSPLHLGCEADRWKKMKETLRMATDAILAKHLLDVHRFYCSCDVHVKNTLQDDILMNEKRHDIMDGGGRKRNLKIEPTTPSKVIRICPSSDDCSSGLRDQELKSNGDRFGDGANTHVHDSLNSTDTTSKEDRKLIEGEDFVVYKAEDDDVESSNEETDSDVPMAAPEVTIATRTKTMVTDRPPVKQETPDSDDDTVSKSSSRTLCADPRLACRVPQDGTDHSSFLIKQEPPCSNSEKDPQDIVSTLPSDSVYLDRDEATEHSPSVEAGLLSPSPSLSSGGLLMKLLRSQTEHRPEILESLAKQKPQIKPACRVPQDGTDDGSFPIKEEPLCSYSEQDPRVIVSTQPSDQFYIKQEIVKQPMINTLDSSQHGKTNCNSV